MHSVLKEMLSSHNGRRPYAAAEFEPGQPNPRVFFKWDHRDLNSILIMTTCVNLS